MSSLFATTFCSEPENVSLSGEDAADMAPAALPWAGPRSDVEARLVRCGARRRGSGCAARTRNECRAGMDGRLVTAQAHTRRQVQAMSWARAYRAAADKIPGVLRIRRHP